MRHHQHKPIPPTFDELLAKVRDLPEGYRGHILDGAVHVSEPRSAKEAHTLAEIAATFVAGSPLGDPVPDAWTFLSNVELSIGAEGLITADIAGFRMGKAELASAATPVRVVPAWVCEVLGRGARCFTLTAKRQAYAEIGVSHLWIADPDAHVLEVFQNQRGRWLLVASLSEEAAASAPPFEELHFDASELWLPAPPAKPAPPSSASRKHASD